jgi:chorismate mutase
MQDHTIAYRHRGAAEPESLETLAGLVVRRLALGQDVAAAKFPDRQLIEDPAREQVVLQMAAGGLNAAGERRDLGLQFARDQVEASRVLQRALHQRWYTHPEEVPAVHRDLITEVRPDLDRVTADLVQAFANLTDLPQWPRGAIDDLVTRQFAATLPAPPLPRLYRHAALFALRLFCLKCEELAA